MAVELNNVPVAAAALYNLLTGLFTFIDEQVEPKKLGVITSGKMQWVAQQVGMQAEFAGTHSLAPEVLATTYSDLECQYYVVPAELTSGTGNAPFEYSFEEPDIPGLTKAGFIKMQALGLILTAGPGGASGDMQYRFLQRCISTFPLSYTDPMTGVKLTFPPLPPQHVVSWYVSAFAKTILRIEDPTPAAIQARAAARHQHVNAVTTHTHNLHDQQLQGRGHGNPRESGGTGIYAQEQQHSPPGHTQAGAPGPQHSGPHAGQQTGPGAWQATNYAIVS